MSLCRSREEIHRATWHDPGHLSVRFVDPARNHLAVGFGAVRSALRMVSGRAGGIHV